MTAKTTKTTKATPAKVTKATTKAPAKVTTELPSEILGVKAQRMTPAKAAAYWTQGDVQRIQACIAARYLVAAHKVKTVRDMADLFGVASGTVDRANRAAEIVLAIGPTATADHAKAAQRIANNLSAYPIGSLKDFTSETSGPALGKALPKVMAAVADAASTARAAKADKPAKARDGKVTKVTNDKTRGQAAASVLAAIKDGSKVAESDVRAILAHALRIAAESKISAEDLASEVAAYVAPKATPAKTTKAPAKVSAAAVAAEVNKTVAKVTAA